MLLIVYSDFFALLAVLIGGIAVISSFIYYQKKIKLHKEFFNKENKRLSSLGTKDMNYEIKIISVDKLNNNLYPVRSESSNRFVLNESEFMIVFERISNHVFDVSLKNNLLTVCYKVNNVEKSITRKIDEDEAVFFEKTPAILGNIAGMVGYLHGFDQAKNRQVPLPEFLLLPIPTFTTYSSFSPYSSIYSLR